MYQKTVIVVSDSSLHARPASEFVRLASTFRSELFVELPGKKINAKSIIGVLSAGIGNGVEVVITGEGIDSKEAVERLCRFLSEELQEMDRY
ncbi:HPr family phosphocarrier protein [Filifactor villosus]|uniref:HPr family phosphocarrier protein n=1 Tax=Filifactor villosus TaxID=29374 RepID=A0ABV9QKM1_9FIRM